MFGGFYLFSLFFFIFFEGKYEDLWASDRHVLGMVLWQYELDLSQIYLFYNYFVLCWGFRFLIFSSDLVVSEFWWIGA